MPLSVAHWNITCSGPELGVAVASAMETRAGLRWAFGRERILSRTAVPSVQAVDVVKVVKVCPGLVSWEIRTSAFLFGC